MYLNQHANVFKLDLLLQVQIYKLTEKGNKGKIFK